MPIEVYVYIVSVIHRVGSIKLEDKNRKALTHAIYIHLLTIFLFFSQLAECAGSNEIFMKWQQFIIVRI